MTRLKLLLPLLLFTLIAQSAWGATYYASPTGSGTTCSEASPGPLDYAIITKAGAAGDTVIVEDGTYGPFNSITFSGVKKHVQARHNGAAIVSFNSGVDGFFLSAGASESTITGLNLIGNTTGKFAILFGGADSVVISDCTFSTITGKAVGYQNTSINNIIQRCVFRDIVGCAIYAEGSCSVTVNYSQFYRCATGSTMDFINVIGAATATINNSVLIGGGTRSILRGSGEGTTLTVNNSLLGGAGNLTKYPTATIVQASSATVTANNCAVPSSMLKVALTTSGTVTLNNCQSSFNPRVIPIGYGSGIVSFYAVDSNHLSSGSLVNYTTGANAAGVHITYYPDDTDQADISDYTSTLQSFVASGHDLGCEGKSSSRLDLAAPFSVSYVGAGANPRVVINADTPASASVALVTDSGTDLTVNISKNPIYTQYIGRVVTQGGSLVKAIDDHADWAITMADPDSTASYDDTYSYTLASGTISVSGVTAIPFSAAALFNEEVVLAKSDIETVVGGGYSVKSFFFPRYKNNTGALSYLKSSGYTSALYGKDTIYQLSAIDSMYALTNDFLNSTWPTNMRGADYATLTDAQKQARVRGWAADLAVGVKFYGYWMALLLPESSGVTSDELMWVASELQAGGVNVLSMAEATASISANGTPSGDGYTRSVAQTYIPSLQAGSPCINAGVALGDDYDEDFAGYDQDNYGSGWEIGTYSYLGPKLNGIPNGTLLKWNGVNIGNIKMNGQ